MSKPEAICEGKAQSFILEDFERENHKSKKNLAMRKGSMKYLKEQVNTPRFDLGANLPNVRGLINLSNKKI